MVDFTAQNPADEAAVEDLLDRAFGPGRLDLPSYRLRQGVAPIAGLKYAAWDGDKLVGTFRFWPLVIGGTAPALLLGPLAVDAAYRRRAIASTLIERGLEDAGKAGHPIVTAVGKLGLFGRFGFVAAKPLGLVMPGLADGNRLLVLGELDGATGRLSQPLDEID
ncbi:MAG: N-acetyltransferase [Alphaproteobacteria bacterium]|jgi:predicted N-acetyltransferase YhbS